MAQVRTYSVKLPVKLAVLSPYLPPDNTGTAILMHRVFRDVEPDDYCLLSSRPTEESTGADPRRYAQPRLPARSYMVAPRFRLRRYSRFRLQWARELINYGFQIAEMARRVADVLRRESCEAIIASTGGPYELPAAWLASRRVGLPLYAYIGDYWRYQFHHAGSRRSMPLYPYVAQLLEPIVLRGAAGVVVLNEFMADAYRRQYGVKPTIIRVPLPPAALEGDFDAPWPAERDELRIVFTGQIYDINLDAFHNMIEAISRLGRPEVKLHVYTAQPWEELEARGVRGPVVFHEQLPPPEFFAMQRRADILFMPLAFKSPYPEIVRTTAPGKLPEYLASGRPILAHAPPDSFAAWYLNRHQCGVFVDRREPALLVQAIQRICEDLDLRQRLRKRAQALARADFTLEAAHAQWVELLRSPGLRPPRVKRLP